jgi:hypothetical protein
MLGEQGIQVARRTVAKYREALKIAPGPSRWAKERKPGPRVRGVVDLGQVLEVQPRVDLRGADAGVAQQLLHRAQVAAGLQQVAGKAVAQHVRVHVWAARRRRRTGQRLAQLAVTQALPAPADEQRRLRRPAPASARSASQLCSACRPAAPIGTARGACCPCPAHGHRRCPGPASRGRWVRPGDPARSAPPPAGHSRRAARRWPGRGHPVPDRWPRRLLGQGHRLIHRQGLGQGAGRLGWAQTVHRVVADLTFTAQPAVQPAPGGQGGWRCCASPAPGHAARPPSAASGGCARPGGPRQR